MFACSAPDYSISRGGDGVSDELHVNNDLSDRLANSSLAASSSGSSGGGSVGDSCGCVAVGGVQQGSEYSRVVGT